MASNWIEYQLDEIAILRNGAGIKQQFFSESKEAVPLVKVSNFTSNSVDSKELTKVDYEHAQKWKSHVFDIGDIVVATVGSWPPNWSSVVGKVIRVPHSVVGAIQNQNTCSIHPKEQIDKDFLYYVLKSDIFLNYVVNVAQGSANQARVPVKKLGGFKFKAPKCINEQKRLARSLVSSDSKIELNRQTNQTLEQMAQALFKSWFVDFDPVFDNALASGLAVNDFPEALQKKAAQRLQVQQQIANEEPSVHKKLSARKKPSADKKAEAKPLSQAATASEQWHQLFPSEFEQTDEPSIGINGWIPKGWERSNLKSFGKVVTGKTPPKKIENAFADKGCPFITPSDVDSDVFALTVARYLSLDGVTSVKNNVIEQGSVCVTCIGSQMGKTEIAPYKSVTNQQLNSIVVEKQSYRNYIFMNLRLRREELFNLGSSGSTMPILNKTSFEGLDILKPTEFVLNEFSKVTEKLIDKILLDSHQNEELSKVRDTLLPKLISGELTLPADHNKT